MEGNARRLDAIMENQTDKVYIDGKVVFGSSICGEAKAWAIDAASNSGVECIVSLDGGLYGYRIEFLYDDDISEATR